MSRLFCVMQIRSTPSAFFEFQDQVPSEGGIHLTALSHVNGRTSAVENIEYVFIFEFRFLELS